MAKHKKICFRRAGRRMLEGRQDGVIYRIFEPLREDGETGPALSVQTYDTKELGRDIYTSGHKHFTRDGAVEFCQQIAAGEVDLEALRAEFEAADMAKERAAVMAATEAAKKFRDRLEAAGLKYTDLLELEALRHNLGDMGHNILLGYERGEGWPESGEGRRAEHGTGK